MGTPRPGARGDRHHVVGFQCGSVDHGGVAAATIVRGAGETDVTREPRPLRMSLALVIVCVAAERTCGGLVYEPAQPRLGAPDASLGAKRRAAEYSPTRGPGGTVTGCLQTGRRCFATQSLRDHRCGRSTATRDATVHAIDSASIGESPSDPARGPIGRMEIVQQLLQNTAAGS